LHPIVMHSHYSASKAGLLMLTKSLALELAPHKIMVNAIAPGVIWTAGLDQQLRGFCEPAGMTADQLLQATVYPRVPVARLGEPDDVAKVALFLASEAANYMTGDVIVVDGGYLLT
jgi:2-deoxy-D-gluconate 3-dehydrogenase